MPNLTLALPPDIHTRMKVHKEVRWSEVARKAIADYLQRLETLDRMDQLLEKSTLTLEDVEELDPLLKAGIAQRHRDWMAEANEAQA